MFALDLFNNDHERRIAEGAVDQLEQRRIDDLAMKMDDLVARAKTAKTAEVKAALMKEFQKCKAERDSYHMVRNETMGYGTLTGEGQVTPTATGIRHHARPENYGGYEPEADPLAKLDKAGTNKLEKAMGIKFDRQKKYQGGLDVDEGGIPGNVPTEKIPGKEDLLKGRGRSYYEGQEPNEDDYEQLLNAIAALYGPKIWDNDAMGDLANDLEQANPTPEELNFIIKHGKLPKRLQGIKFTNNDTTQFGEAAYTGDHDTDEKHIQHLMRKYHWSRQEAEEHLTSSESDREQFDEAKWDPWTGGDFSATHDMDHLPTDNADDSQNSSKSKAEQFKAMIQYYSNDALVTRALDELYRITVGGGYHNSVSRPEKYLGTIENQRTGKTEKRYFKSKEDAYRYAKGYNAVVTNLEKIDNQEDTSDLITLPVMLGMGDHKKKWMLKFPSEDYAQKWEFKYKNAAQIQWPGGHGLAEAGSVQAKTDDALRAYWEKVKREKQAGIPSNNQKKNSKQVKEVDDPQAVHDAGLKLPIASQYTGDGQFKVTVKNKPYIVTVAGFEIDDVNPGILDSFYLTDVATGKTEHVTSAVNDPRAVAIYNNLENSQRPALKEIYKQDIELGRRTDWKERPERLQGLKLSGYTATPADRFIKGHQDMKKVTGQDLDEGRMGEIDAMRQDLERMNERQFYTAYGISKAAFQQKYRTLLKPALDENQQLHQGDPIVVTAPNEFEGKTGEIYEFSPSGTFVIVDLYNHGKHSMHLSDVEYNQHADQEETDDWYDEEMEEGYASTIGINPPALDPVSQWKINVRQLIADYIKDPQALYRMAKQKGSNSAEAMAYKYIMHPKGKIDLPANAVTFEGFVPLDKYSPTAVCIAGKPVKKFDYYKDAENFYKNWKQKLYREGNKEKADKITLMPIMDEAANAAQQAAIAIAMKRAGKKPKSIDEVATGNLHADLADVYRRMAPGIERHRDSFKAGQLYDALEAVAEQHNAHREFTRMMGGARNRAHMDYDTNPGGFQNWFWYLPFAEEELEEGSDLINMSDLQFYKELLGVMVIPVAAFGAMAWHKAMNAIKLYRAEDVVTALQKKGVTVDLSTLEQIKPLLLKLEQAIDVDKDGDVAKELAKRIQQTVTWGKLKQANPDTTVNRKSEVVEEQDTSGVERAILNRIMVAHTDLLMKFGPDKVMQAAEEVAYNVGDVDEIGTSDVSAYVNQVRQILGA